MSRACSKLPQPPSGEDRSKHAGFPYRFSEIPLMAETRHRHTIRRKWSNELQQVGRE
jgi:hypothetical protein